MHMSWSRHPLTLHGCLHLSYLRAQEINMFIVFFISGLSMNTTELRKAMQRDSLPSVIFGWFMIIVVTPTLGFAMREIPLSPPAFSVGQDLIRRMPAYLHACSRHL